MKIKERIRPLLNALQITVGCIIALLAGVLAGTCVICAFAACSAGWNWTPSENSQAIFYCILCLPPSSFMQWCGADGSKTAAPENNRQNL